MYLISTYDQEMGRKIATCEVFGPRFSDEEVDKSDKLEVWGTSFDDEGDDYCEFRLLKENEIISTKRVDGY
jgi:hypothetical protein